MSSCYVEAKRDYFNSPGRGYIASPASSPGSPVLLGPRHQSAFHASPDLYQLPAHGFGDPRMAPPEPGAAQTRPDAVYEQPAPKVAPQLARQAAATPRLSSFRPAVGRERRSSGRNSVESVQSKLSSSSATNVSDEAKSQSPHHGGRNTNAGGHTPRSTVLVGTRPVSPPEVRPLAPVGPDQSFTQVAAAPEQEGAAGKQAGLAPVPLAKLRSCDRHHQSRQLNLAHQQKGVSSVQQRYDLDLRLSVDARSGELVTKTPALANSKSCDKLSGKSTSSAGSHGPAGSEASSAAGAHSNGKPGPRQIGKRQAPFMFAGILASMLGSVFFSFAILTIKLLPDSAGLAEKTKIACWRGATMMVLCSASILKDRSGFLVPRDEILINVLRSIFGFMGIYMSYISLKYISMGDATALVFSSPVWTSLLSHYILHEPLKWMQLLALPLSLIGIILIAHPSLLINMELRAGPLERQPLLELADNPVGELFKLSDAGGNSSAAQNLTGRHSAALEPDLNRDLDIAMNASEHFDYEHRWKGIVIALACSFVVSLVYIVLKFRKTTPIQTATFWLAFTNFFGSLFIGMFVGLGEFPSKLSEISLLLFNGVCSWFGQCLLQWALGYEDASVLSVVRTLDVAMSFSLSAIFLHEEILWTSILGAAIIVTVVVSIMLSNYIQNKLCPSRAADSQRTDTPLSRSTEAEIESETDSMKAYDLVKSEKSAQQYKLDNRYAQPHIAKQAKTATVGA